MKRNNELLGKTMKHIMDHPEEHQQGTWITDAHCGTAACFAGHALLLDGYSVQQVRALVDHGWDSSIKRVAAEELGLTGQEACTLFLAHNTRDMLRLMVRDLMHGEPLREAYQYKYEAESLRRAATEPLGTTEE